MDRLALLAACALFAAPGPARAEAPPTLPSAWSVLVEPDDGFKIGFTRDLAVHADGTALLAITQEKDESGTTRHRILVQSVAADGKVLARTMPEIGAAQYIGALAVAAEADGFALVTTTAPGRVPLFRLARDGRVRAQQPLRFGRRALMEISGLAADGRGNLLAYGGVDEGPHAPGIAAIDRNGRIAWFFDGKIAMPPGGVRAARLRRDGGNDAVVMLRERPSWERRSAQGALLARAALPRHWNCWNFLDERRLVTMFFNWEEQPLLPQAPVKRWVLALAGPDGRFVPGHVVFDPPAAQNATCQLAVHDAGWVAAALDPPKISLFDRNLALRAEIDLAPHGATEIEALAVDAKGAVTVLVDTLPTNQPGRKLLLLRFAPAR